MNRFRALGHGFCALAILGGSLAFGDEIIFKNGDKLTGTIEKLDGGKLKIKKSVAGDITVDMKDVQTFSTDAPVELHLTDGSVLKQQVNQGAQPDTIQTVAGAAAQGQPVALADVKSVNPGYGQWTGAVTVGGLVTRGNSNTENLNVSGDATLRGEKDRFSLGAGYFFGRQRDPATGVKSTTTDNWFAQGKYDYFFSKKWYGYASLRGEHDRIADLDLRLTPSIGVGYQWVERPDLAFSTEAGLAYVYEQYADDGSDEHVAARLAYHFQKKFNDKVSFVHNLEFLPSLEDISDYNLNADAGIRATISGNMFTELKIEYRLDETPAPGAEKNDLRYILGVGWTF